LHDWDLWRAEHDQLKSEEIKGKRVVVVGSGASGVEAVELAVAKGADDIKILARDDKVRLRESKLAIVFLT
jgi:cation diffusion facilitator CzcD-associated flavoprotein CzcO